MRERVEPDWLLLDPHCGQTIAIEFLVLSHGKIVVPRIDEYSVEEDDLRLLLARTLQAINYLPALPTGQDDLTVAGEFISLPPPY